MIQCLTFSLQIAFYLQRNLLTVQLNRFKSLVLDKKFDFDIKVVLTFQKKHKSFLELNANK